MSCLFSRYSIIACRKLPAHSDVPLPTAGEARAAAKAAGHKGAMFLAEGSDGQEETDK